MVIRFRGDIRAPKKGRINKILHKKGSDYIITSGAFIKEDCIKYLNIPEEKIEVIYLAADKRYNYLKNKQELKDELRFKYNINDLFILYVGTVESRKNVSLLIKSFHELKKLGVVINRAETFVKFKGSYQKTLD